MSRIEPLKALVAANPTDARVRFMLGMEYMSAGEREAAIDEFEALLAFDADYVAAYFQAGRCAEAQDNVAAARDYYERGIEAARRTVNRHAEDEISDALSFLS